MKVCCYRIITTSICIGLFIFLVGQQKVQGQQENHLSFDDIIKTLAFKSRISKSTKEINEQLIKDVRKRGIEVILTSEEEKSLKKAGASKLLIKLIRESSRKREEQLILYKKHTDNYDGTIEQKKIALEAAKEFVKRYSDVAEFKDIKDIIKYFKANIPGLEKQIANN